MNRDWDVKSYKNILCLVHAEIRKTVLLSIISPGPSSLFRNGKTVLKQLLVNEEEDWRKKHKANET